MERFYNRSSSNIINDQSDPQDNGYDWEQLQEIEAQRRAILKRADLPFGKILQFWDGTCLVSLSSDWLLHVSMGIFILIRIQAHFDEVLPGIVRDLGNTDIDVIGGFLSFFLVLFVNQSNIRFQELFKYSMSCCGKIFDVASLVHITLPPEKAFRMVRYMNAAHAAGYVGLSHTYSQRSFFNPLNAAHQLLTPSEMKRIRQVNMETSPDASFELIEWCLMDVQDYVREKIIDVRDAAALKTSLLAFRSSMGTLYDYGDQPVHFFYIHFLCLLSAFYLPLFSIKSAYSADRGEGENAYVADILYGLIVLLQSIFVIGLRVLGQKMVDVYGDDVEDLSVIQYVKSAWLQSNRILKARRPSSPGAFDNSNVSNTVHFKTSEEKPPAAWDNRDSRPTGAFLA